MMLHPVLSTHGKKRVALFWYLFSRIVVEQNTHFKNTSSINNLHFNPPGPPSGCGIFSLSPIRSKPIPPYGLLRENGVVLREVLVVVSVHDRLVRGVLREVLRARLAVDMVVGATVAGEVGRLVDEGTRLGVRAGQGGVPESTAEVDLSETRRGGLSVKLFFEGASHE